MFAYQNKTLKKILSLGLAVMLVLSVSMSIASCGKDKGEQGETQNTADTTKSPDTTTDASDTTNASGTSDTTKSPDTATTPDTTNSPDTTSAPGTTNTPDTAKTPDTTSKENNNPSTEENADAKLYLELIQKNLAKLTVGYAATQTSSISLTGEKMEETVSQTGEIKSGGGNFYIKSSNSTQYILNKFPVINNSDQECWYIGNNAYIKNTAKTMFGNTTTKIKAELPQGETPAQNLDGFVSKLTPSAEAATSVIQKTTEGTNTVFSFSYDGNINELMNTLPSANATTNISVTVDKDGNLVSAKATAAFDIPKMPTEETAKATEGKGTYEIPGLSGLTELTEFTRGTVEFNITFTSLGVAQNITTPADADQYLTVNIEQFMALLGQYMQKQAQ